MPLVFAVFVVGVDSVEVDLQINLVESFGLVDFAVRVDFVDIAEVFAFVAAHFSAGVSVIETALVEVFAPIVDYFVVDYFVVDRLVVEAVAIAFGLVVIFAVAVIGYLAAEVSVLVDRLVVEVSDSGEDSVGDSSLMAFVETFGQAE